MQTVKKLYLGSQSPRRKEYFNILGINYDVVVSNIDESDLKDEKPLDYLYRVIHLKTESANSIILSQTKRNISYDFLEQKEKNSDFLKENNKDENSDFFKNLHKNSIKKDENNTRENYLDSLNHFVTLTADTVVLIGDTIFQKPESPTKAKEFLRKLSNRWHQVITGFHIFSEFYKIDYYNFVKTDILFKNLSESEVDFYIFLNEYSDKAGGYGIQGAASFMIKEIHGSYSNVVGFPIEEIFGKLQEFEIIKF